MNYTKEENDMDDVIQSIITNSETTFYGLFLSELNRCFSTSTKTACIGKHTASIIPQMYFNPTFWNDLKNKKQKAFLLIHEVEHYINVAWEMDKIFNMTEPEIANIAMDIEINENLLKVKSLEMPHGGGQCIELYKELNLKSEQSSLYYYNELMKAREKKNQSFGQCESLSGLPGKLGSSGCEQLDLVLDGQIVVDLHELWAQLTGDMSEIEKEIFRRQVQEQLERVVGETTKMNGNVPVRIQNKTGKTFEKREPVVSWRTLLRRFVGSSISTDVYNSRKRPNKRYEDAPALRFKHKVRILVGVDQSGSIGEEELEEFFNEIFHMYKVGAKITIASWDTQVHDVRDYKGETVCIRHCQGGTDSNPVIQYANQNRTQFDCFINLTDGFIGNVNVKPGLPTLWVISSTGTTSIKSICNLKLIKINR